MTSSHLYKISFGFLLTVLSIFSAPAKASKVDYAPYTALLKKHVKKSGESSAVNYAALRRDRRALDQFTKKLSSFSHKEYKSWTDPEKIAFLINSYNAFTLKLIVDHYPVESIRKIGGFFSSPWKMKFFKLLGEDTHLDYVEHGTLRKDFKEARIHFAVNCASISCPPLLDEAFLPETLYVQLEAAAEHFLRSPSFNRYDEEKNILYLSSIFKWYGSDFGNEKQLKSQIAKWMQVRSPQTLKNFMESEIQYLDYDWGLNNNLSFYENK